MPFYVFGYGSLMWRPGFPFRERQLADIAGMHRSLCVYSWVHRGTESRPGLVLGLDRGGACRGVVFEVDDRDREDVIVYLREREQVTLVYLEEWVDAKCQDGRSVEALTYVVDKSHPQYAGRLSHDDILGTVRGAVGKSGRNEDYVLATAEHLEEAGIHDVDLSNVAEALRQTAS